MRSSLKHTPSILALIAAAATTSVFAQSSTVVTLPVGENTELASSGDLAADGLSISIDGEPITGPARAIDTQRQTDIALEEADIQVRFDGLTVTPRLDLTLGNDTNLSAGAQVQFDAATNYPDFIDRGELRLIDLDAVGGPKTVAKYPLAPNGSATVTLPDGNLVAVYRVYGANGRFDETEALSLSRLDLTDGDRGFDSTAKRNIQITGGAVTVSGSNVGQGADVQVLGASVTPDPNGRFAVQRILPVGDHGVDVKISGGLAQPVDEVREITIPRSEAFYFAVADVTLGWRRDEAAGIDDSFATGRVSGYWNGRTASGYSIVASVDTGEGPLKDIFRDLDEKDPRNLLLRVTPSDLYPTYGDDSTITDTTPTAGKFYLHVEKNGSYGTWGTFKADVSGGTYLRNERTLYGATGNLQTQAVTENGDARARLQLYAAQPDNLPGRDVFLGTGGAVYFLQRQDISVGSETVSIELRDANTGLIVERIPLTFGRDYAINYIQGRVTLSEPLSGRTAAGRVIANPSGDYLANLVVQYEFTPTTGDVDVFTYGARAEAWITDNLRIGVTGQVEDTDTSDYKAYGADVVYRISEGTYVELDYAKSTGSAIGLGFSTDGGFEIDNQTGVAGSSGEAYRLNIKADYADLGFAGQGAIAAYAERRTAGFSTLDYLNNSVDQDFWGISIEGEPNETLHYALAYDAKSAADGTFTHIGRAELGFALNETVDLDFGVELQDRDTGSRTDVGVRLTYALSETASVYLFGQTTVDRDGLEANDRYGIGGSYAFDSGWEVSGEVSDGTTGVAGRAQIGYSDGQGTTSYFGYELSPDREFAGVTLTGNDRGRFIVGGTRSVNDRLSYYAETSYDLFGQHRSLSNAFGVSYSPQEYLTLLGDFEIGRVEDDLNGDFDRQALSFGLRYNRPDIVTAEARLEYRTDKGVLSGTPQDLDAFLLNASARYKISDDARLVFNLSASKTEVADPSASFADGELVDLSFGYAYRPTRNDKLNVLLKYRYLRDFYGQRIDDTDVPGPKQESHVLSVDAEYDLNENWSVGGKLGVRLSETAAAGSSTFTENNAALAVVNARYHLVHNWDVLLEARAIGLEQAGTAEIGALGAVYRHLGNNVKVGVGYNFGTFSDDLTDLTFDDQGAFLNIVAKF